MKKQAGFTLIEIAIVLVIIGLLLGGVLKGQEMITNSKIKRTSNDYNGVAAAVYSYLDRYSALPGDDVNAAGRWGLGAGDGDGVIENAAERALVWSHLRASGLIAGTGDNNPIHAFGGEIIVQDGGYGLASTTICMNSMSGKIGDILDMQLDDGVFNTGEMRASAVYAQTATNLTICKHL